MIPPRPTELAHDFLRRIICEGDTVIDATAGNGHDTVFLAKCSGTTGRVLAFDIQESAIQSSRSRIEAAGFSKQVEFHQKCHTTIADYAENESIAAIMFNLGFLPGGDQQLTTATSKTLIALTSASLLLKPGGILSIVCYPGHGEGSRESIAVESWVTHQINPNWKIAKYSIIGTLEPAPFLIIAHKKSPDQKHH